MKITIVLTYYQRQKQLTKTLDSFRQYGDNIKVVVVDDNSPDDISIDTYPFEVNILKLKEKKWIAPCPVFNFGFIHALKDNPDVIMFQNAECYHKGDLMSSVKSSIKDDNYLTFACYSLSSNQDVNFKSLSNRTAVSNGDSAWYNHSIYRPEVLHFCAAITAGNLKKLNGFDERFSEGLGYEDNYFIHQVRTLGLKVKIIDDPFVFHQYHYDTKAFTFNERQYSLNAALCKELMKGKDYRAVHFYTQDL